MSDIWDAISLCKDPLIVEECTAQEGVHIVLYLSVLTIVCLSGGALHFS